MSIAHICGILIALVAHSEISVSSSCSWYFVAYTFDTTVGVLLTLLLHHLVIHQAKSWRSVSQEEVTTLPEALQNDRTKLMPEGEDHSTGRREHKETVSSMVADCGNYGSPINPRKWAVQTIEWSTCVVIARAFCGLCVLLLAPALQGLALGLDNAFAGHPTLLLFFVMVCCPLIMNGTQLLLQDAVLKANLITWPMGGELSRIARSQGQTIQQTTT